MAENERTTVYLEPALRQALRLKAAEMGMNVSALVNEAIRAALIEDLEDADALDLRADEPSRPFEDFLRELSDDGAL
jgi:hypothetical protein